MSREFTAIFEKHGRWYIGYVEEIPGVNAQGRTLAEARENLKEAVQLILEENRRLMPQKRSSTRKREAITVEVWVVPNEAPSVSRAFGQPGLRVTPRRRQTLRLL